MSDFLTSIYDVISGMSEKEKRLTALLCVPPIILGDIAVFLMLSTAIMRDVPVREQAAIAEYAQEASEPKEDAPMYVEETPGDTKTETAENETIEAIEEIEGTDRLSDETAELEEVKRQEEEKLEQERLAAEKAERLAQEEAARVAREEAELLAAEEAKRQAEEAARLEEEREARLAAERQAEEAARIAEEQRVAEEARAAEEARRAEEARIADEAAEWMPQEEAAQPSDSQALVWVSDDGSKYHRYRDCSGMDNNVREVTVQEAYDMGRTPCKRCHPPT